MPILEKWYISGKDSGSEVFSIPVPALNPKLPEAERCEVEAEAPAEEAVVPPRGRMTGAVSLIRSARPLNTRCACWNEGGSVTGYGFPAAMSDDEGAFCLRISRPFSASLVICGYGTQRKKEGGT